MLQYKIFMMSKNTQLIGLVEACGCWMVSIHKRLDFDPMGVLAAFGSSPRAKSIMLLVR
jgi:hypothetical protein